MSEIKDSGDRTTYPSGAVRDRKKGKGDFNLVPDCAFDFGDVFLDDVMKFKHTGKTAYLHAALADLSDVLFVDQYDMLLEVSIHFEEGADKYEIDNWKKGIPVSSFMDSAIRHYCKHMAGWKDERHDRAVVWNVICAIWTMENKPELDDYTAVLPV